MKAYAKALDMCIQEHKMMHILIPSTVIKSSSQGAVADYVTFKGMQQMEPVPLRSPQAFLLSGLPFAERSPKKLLTIRANSFDRGT